MSSKEVKILKTGADLLTMALQAMITAQEVNSLMLKLQTEKRSMTDAEEQELDSKLQDSLSNLRAAIAAK